MPKIQTKHQKLSKKWKKIVKNKKRSILWLANEQGKIFERFKASNKFINMVKSEGKANIASLFAYFGLAVLVHF